MEKKNRARVSLVGSLQTPESKYLLTSVHAALTLELSDLIIVDLPIEIPEEFKNDSLAKLETHHDQLADLEEAHLVVAVGPDDVGTIFNIGLAYGLRKQIIVLSPRSTDLPEVLQIPVMLHVTPEAFVDPATPFTLNISGQEVRSLDFEHGLDSALLRLIDVIRSLAPLYIYPQDHYGMLATIAGAIKSKWEKKD